MRNLLISQKLMFVAVAVSIPVIVLSYFFVAEKNQTIVRTRGELDGSQYLRPLRRLAVDVAAHRDLSAAVLAGDASFAADLAKSSVAVDDDFKEILAQQARTELAAAEDLSSVRSDWETIKAATAGDKLDTSFEQHTRYLAKILQFTALIANESSLILDSDVDSHYLVDSLIFRIPKLSAEISSARAQGAAFYAAGSHAERSANRRLELAAIAVRINDALYETNHFIHFAAGKGHPRTEEALGGIIAENNRVINNFSSTLVDRVVNGTGSVMQVADYVKVASAPLESCNKLWDASVTELDRLLDDRNLALQRTVEYEILIVGLAMLLTVGFLFLVARAITQPIKHLSEVADRISLGDMDATINIDSHDEIGELGERFRRLQVSLRAAMEALERHSEG